MAASNLQDVDSVSAFIDSSLSQSDAATTIAAGTLGLVILVWASYLGLKRDIDTQGFRWLGFLVFPFVLGLVAVICSYVLYALTTGCRFELMTGEDMSASTSSSNILDPVKHFIDQYARWFVILGFMQILSSTFAASLVWI